MKDEPLVAGSLHTALGFAALIGVIAVVDAGGAGSAVAIGAGTTFTFSVS